MKKFIEYLWERFTGFLRPPLKKLIGWEAVQGEIDTLRYIVDNYIDITNFPQSTGLLRKCQLADAELLRIVHEICQKHSIQYWLSRGTLLGAVRHSGFIPWDDDMDICMTRENYNKALRVFPKELKKFNIWIDAPSSKKISISIWGAGLSLDVFPVDSFELEYIEMLHNVRDKLIEYRKYYVRHRDDDIESLEKMKRTIIGSKASIDPLWYHNPEIDVDGDFYKNDVIFPLKTLRFEGYEFFVPNDCDRYLTIKYGDYMHIPRNGVLHHCGGKGRPLYENSIKHKVNMDDLLETLKSYKVDY